MDNAVKRLCTICARGGSKGVKNKNLRKIDGKSLICITVEQARLSGAFSDIAFSSDSLEILAEAERSGVGHLIHRPDDLAQDESDKSPAIVHCARQVELITGIAYDVFVDLDVTAPLRTPMDIVGVLALLEDSEAENVITVCPSRRSPYFNMVERREGRIQLCGRTETPILCRQDSPITYDMNASIYAWKRGSFFAGAPVFLPKTEVFVMDELTCFDLDSEHDFRMISLLYDVYVHGGKS